MQKDEVIQFHTFLFQLKNQIMEIVDDNQGFEFQSYEKLNVAPYQVNKSMREHELAVFLLSMGIADLLSHNKQNDYISLKLLNPLVSCVLKTEKLQTAQHLITPLILKHF